MKKAYKILLAASFLVNFGDNLIGPFYAVYVENIGGSILDIGYTATVFCFSTGILMIIIGKLSDKLNKEIITIFGYGLYALGSLAYLFITAPWQLFGLQVVFGLGSACLSAPLVALFARHIQKGKEGEQWGLEGGGTFILVGISAFVGTLIVNNFGFRLLFIIMFSIQVTATIVQSTLYFNKKK